MYPLNTLTDALSTALWDRAVQIADKNKDQLFTSDPYAVFAQLQRDVVAHLIDNLGELGESPAMKREREECAYSKPQPSIEEDAEQTIDINDGLDAALWDKAGLIAQEKQLDAAQRRSLYSSMRDGIEIGIEGFEQSGER